MEFYKHAEIKNPFFVNLRKLEKIKNIHEVLISNLKISATSNIYIYIYQYNFLSFHSIFTGNLILYIDSSRTTLTEII